MKGISKFTLNWQFISTEWYRIFILFLSLIWRYKFFPICSYFMPRRLESYLWKKDCSPRILSVRLFSSSNTAHQLHPLHSAHTYASKTISRTARGLTDLPSSHIRATFSDILGRFHHTVSTDIDDIRLHNTEIFLSLVGSHYSTPSAMRRISYTFLHLSKFRRAKGTQRLLWSHKGQSLSLSTYYRECKVW